MHARAAAESPPRVRRDPGPAQQDRVRGPLLLARQACQPARRPALEEVSGRDVVQGRDSNGISKPPQIQLVLPHKISFIKHIVQRN